MCYVGDIPLYSQYKTRDNSNPVQHTFLLIRIHF